jgi:broad specificity phosphatase PhoE
MRIILIRHGESTANVDPLVYTQVPDHLIQLTDSGKRQAFEAGIRVQGILQGDSYGVFASPYNRTLETMRHALEAIDISPVLIHQDPRLREQDYGPLRSLSESDALRKQRSMYGRFFYRFPGGESCADIFDRISSFLETLHRRFGEPNFPENILIFSHATAIACFLMRWYHWEYQKFESFTSHPPNCHLVMLEKKSSGDYHLKEPFEKFFTP